MKRFNKLFLTVIFASAFFASCSSDDDNTPEPRGSYDGGIFVVNEGNNGTPNGTIAYISDDLKVENDVFKLVNTEKATGDTPQSIGFNGDLAYIVTNGSNKIELVNRYTFKSIATITTGLKNPRFIAFANGKGYVTNWGDPGSSTDDYVAVLDLSSNTITSTIPVVEGPEKIIENDGKLYVAHKGGWNQGNSLTVINTSTNTVATNFVVGDVPSSLVKNNGTLYILCDGKPFYADVETAGKIVKLSLSSNTISSTINFPEKTHPGFLDIENNKMYYTVGKEIYSADLTASSLPATSLFTASKVTNLYGFAVKNNQIYLADAVNYSDAGNIYIHSLSGVLSTTLTVGITPNGFYFNN
ncbi:YncE family protein [Flavobacterium procerum]|uniref:YncE family protein n=1 Tax=Flavobacterium procerum TaxID=1455569 RepID=A0ABV6BKU1_9FLAO